MNGGRRARTFVALLGAAVVLLAPQVSSGADAAVATTARAARMSRASGALEYWNVIAQFDAGYRLLARLGTTNEGPGERNAGAVWYLVLPNGRVAQFSNGRSKDWWKLSPDRLRLDVASSSLDLHPPLGRLALDTRSQGGKIDLTFPLDDASVRALSAPTAPFQTVMLQIAAPIQGTIWARGMPAPVPVHGVVTLTHAWTDDSLAQTVQRLIEFVAQTNDTALYLSDLTTPDGERRRWVSIERGGVVVDDSSEVGLTLEPGGPVKGERDYPVPGRLLVHDQRATLEIRPERLLLRTNPLSGIPQPFRFLFSLRVAPQWVWIDAAFHLTVRDPAGGQALETDGHGILSVTFINP